MQPATVVLIYVIIWWVILFMALPIGLRGSGIDPKTGAPKILTFAKKRFGSVVSPLLLRLLSLRL